MYTGEEEVLKVKINKHLTKILSTILFFTFIFSNQLRIGLMGEKLGAVNYIAGILILWILWSFRFRLSKKCLVFNVLFCIYFFGTSIFYQSGVEKIIYAFISFIVPLFLISINLNSIEFKFIFRRFLKIFNLLIIIITVMGILDILTAGNISLVISRFVSDRLSEIMAMQKYESVKRLYSIMGHPLFNTELYLMYFICNSFYNKYIDKIISHNLLIIISVIGIAMTASKTGLILIIIAIIFVNSKNLNIKHFIFIGIVILLLFGLGVFNSTITRLLEGNLTTGRSEKWQIVQNYNIYPMKFFTGYGLEFTFFYNSILDWASAAYEYPFRMFSLESGILNTIFIYISIFIYPVYKLIKRKHIQILMGFAIVFLDVNTYNGLALKGDYMLIFCIFNFIILNLSNNLEVKSIK